MELHKAITISVRFVLALVATGVAAYACAKAISSPVPIEDDQISRFEGVWAGEDNLTPLGPMPFAMVFERQKNGDLFSHSALSQQTWVDLRFHKDEEGNWLLTEAAAMVGAGAQSYTLHPVKVSGDTLDWAYLEKPGFLNCRMTADAEKLWMIVYLHGEEHVQFLLHRMTGEAADEVRRAMIVAGKSTGEDDWKLLRKSGEGEDPVEILKARAKVRMYPENAEAHLGLASALGEVIGEAPPDRVPLYAQELFASLQKAVDLDSTLPGAHYGLAKYYLQAPTFAGGSLEKAESEAETLIDLGSPLGEVAMAKVEARRGDRKTAVTRLKDLLTKNPDFAEARRALTRISGRSIE